MAKVDPKFFEKLTKIYIKTKNFTADQERILKEYAQFIDKTLNTKEQKN